jgi:hypothetical protein
MADELEDPASNENTPDRSSRCDAGSGGGCGVEERNGCDRRGERERHVEQKVVRENRTQENVREVRLRPARPSSSGSGSRK